MTRPFLWLAAFCLRKPGLDLFAGGLIVCAFAACPASASPNDLALSVRLFQAHRPIRQIQVLPPFEIVGTTNLVTSPMCLEVQEGKLYIRNAKNQRQALNAPLRIRGSGRRPVSLLVPHLSPRRYHGDIFIGAGRDGSLQIINRVHLRDYINDVVASEIPAKTPREALKAQAVLAQTLSLKRNRPDDLGDSTEGQSYLGAGAERPEVTSAVSAVWGEILCYQETPVVAYYHSTCAGSTSQAAEYFGLDPGSLPYLKAVACKNCSQSPFWKPTREQIPMAVFGKVFGDGLPTVLKRDEAGRPLSVKLANGKLLTGYQFWMQLGQSLGWDKAPGTRFSFARDSSDHVLIESTGAGHGVGLCQWGASGLAAMGKSYIDILRYYYPGCQVCGRH